MSVSQMNLYPTKVPILKQRKLYSVIFFQLNTLKDIAIILNFSSTHLQI